MDELPTVLRTVVAGVGAYLALIFVLRVSGKRTLAKWNAFDFVVTIALGSVLASTLTASQTRLMQGVTGLAVLIALQFAIAWLTIRFTLIQRLTKARPRLLLRDGRFDEDALRDERVAHSEVLAAIRSSGIGSIDKVAAVVLETDGSVSVIRRDGGLDSLQDVEGYREDGGRVSAGDATGELKG